MLFILFTYSVIFYVYIHKFYTSIEWLYMYIIVATQRALDVKMTSYQRRCDVMTSHRRRSDVIFTSCARWVGCDFSFTLPYMNS